MQEAAQLAGAYAFFNVANPAFYRVLLLRWAGALTAWAGYMGAP